MDNYKSINKALNINSEVVPTPEDLVSKKGQLKKVEEQDIGKDYDYTRGNLYSLIEKGQEAINGIMEVAGQLIKSVADTTDKLMDRQKKVKEVEEDTNKTTNNVTNNALFVGSTSELSKMLKQGILNNKEASNPKNEKV